MLTMHKIGWFVHCVLKNESGNILIPTGKNNTKLDRGTHAALKHGNLLPILNSEKKQYSYTFKTRLTYSSDLDSKVYISYVIHIVKFYFLYSLYDGVNQIRKLSFLMCNTFTIFMRF